MKKNKLYAIAVVFLLALSINGIVNAKQTVEKDDNIQSLSGANPIVITKVKASIFGISFCVKNEGDEPMQHITWEIFVTGGFYGNINRSSWGKIEILNPGETSPTQFIGSIRGFGKIYVDWIASGWNMQHTVAYVIEETLAGFQLGPFTILDN